MDTGKHGSGRTPPEVALAVVGLGMFLVGLGLYKLGSDFGLYLMAGGVGVIVGSHMA